MTAAAVAPAATAAGKLPLAAKAATPTYPPTR